MSFRPEFKLQGDRSKGLRFWILVVRGSLGRGIGARSFVSDTIVIHPMPRTSTWWWFVIG
ncbi:MAG: hypothetical protein AAFY20_15455 [Cyanobacteria bacterium J06639_14]